MHMWATCVNSYTLGRYATPSAKKQHALNIKAVQKGSADTLKIHTDSHFAEALCERI